jgi:hypothetical protein
MSLAIEQSSRYVDSLPPPADCGASPMPLGNNSLSAVTLAPEPLACASATLGVPDSERSSVCTSAARVASSSCASSYTSDKPRAATSCASSFASLSIHANATCVSRRRARTDGCAARNLTSVSSHTLPETRDTGDAVGAMTRVISSRMHCSTSAPSAPTNSRAPMRGAAPPSRSISCHSSDSPSRSRSLSAASSASDDGANGERTQRAVPPPSTVASAAPMAKCDSMCASCCVASSFSYSVRRSGSPSAIPSAS